MPTECIGCQARTDEIAYLRAQVKELTERALAASNPSLHMHLKNPNAAASPGLTHFEDGLGNTFVMVDGKAVPLRDYDKFMSEHGGFIDEDGRYIPAEELARVQAKVHEMMGGNAPTPQ